jgi:hypothetical protein
MRKVVFAAMGLVILTLGVTLRVTLGQEQQQIQVKVNLVSVAFVARDARGALVDNLTQDDVEVFEDTIPQKIAFLREAWMCR